MSTHCTIGMEYEDETIRYVFVHSDGQPTYTGQLLMDCYGSPAKAHELLELGDLAILGREIGEKHPFKYPGEEDEQGFMYQTLAYRRDRGDDWFECKTSVCFSLSEFLTSSYDYIAHYAYLLTDVGWVVYTDSKGKAHPLAEAIAADKAEYAAYMATTEYIAQIDRGETNPTR